MWTKRTWIMVLLLLAIHVLASAQTTTMLRAQWEISGALGPTGGPRPTFTVSMAQGYTYKLYKVSDAAGVVLTPIACTTTQDPYTKTCQAPVPGGTGFDVVGIRVDMTVIISSVESPHSEAAIVPGAPEVPTAPQNFRLLRSAAGVVWRGVVRVPAVLANRRPKPAPSGGGLVLQVPD